MCIRNHFHYTKWNKCLINDLINKLGYNIYIYIFKVAYLKDGQKNASSLIQIKKTSEDMKTNIVEIIFNIKP